MVENKMMMVRYGVCQVILLGCCLLLGCGNVKRCPGNLAVPGAKRLHCVAKEMLGELDSLEVMRNSESAPHVLIGALECPNRNEEMAMYQLVRLLRIHLNQEANGDVIFMDMDYLRAMSSWARPDEGGESGDFDLVEVEADFCVGGQFRRLRSPAVDGMVYVRLDLGLMPVRSKRVLWRSSFVVAVEEESVRLRDHFRE